VGLQHTAAAVYYVRIWRENAGRKTFHNPSGFFFFFFFFFFFVFFVFFLLQQLHGLVAAFRLK
jgi:hypothetical protein